MNTTRRYPRTMREAFPKDTDYACAIEGPEKRYALADMAVFAAVCMGAFTAVLVLAGVI